MNVDSTRIARLHVLIGGAHAGLVHRARGRLTFTYDDAYIDEPNATPLSICMPLSSSPYSGKRVSSFLSGLLPDSDAVRARWAAEFATRDTPFDLLANVGEDCAGAVQLVRDDRLPGIASGGVRWMSDREVGDWIRTLRDDPAGWLHDGNSGQFSLAGAQSKFALHFADGKWGRAYGSSPTTHIIKLAANHFPQHEVNEHLTLRLARSVGLVAADSEIRSFDGEQVVVVARFDRIDLGNGLLRVHQEDMCQALGHPPEMKYENHGGPSAFDIARLLRSRSSAPEDDLQRFVDAIVFNWAIANSDAHAKNYSLLLSGSQCRLAPLYDLASALPYVSPRPAAPTLGELQGSRLKLAMSVAGVYRLADIRLRDWAELFSDLGLDVDEQVARAGDLVSTIARQVDAVCSDDAKAFGNPMAERWADAIRRRANLCFALLDGRGYRTSHRP